MADEIDVKLTLDSDNFYDINFTAIGDFVMDNSFENAVNISVLQNKRADESEHIIPELRNGWWGNELNNVLDYEIGSKLWLLGQAKNIQDTQNMARDYAIDCLQWLLDDGFAKDIQVETGRDSATSILTIEVKIVRFDGEVKKLSYRLWDNWDND